MENIAIIGVGLLGGSLIQALNKYAPHQYCFAGYKRSQKSSSMPNLKYFIGEEQIAALMQWADGIVLCTPVGSFSDILQAIKPFWQKKHWLCDVGSTKKDVVQAILEHVPMEFIHQCIPSHPIAGSHESGWQYADEDLFVGKKLIITPINNYNENYAFQQVVKMWQYTQSKLFFMTATEHDKTFALTSHLPHLLAYSMMEITNHDSLTFAGTGFQDFTRIAQSDARMWSDILLANKEEILEHLNNYQTILSYVAELLSHNHHPELELWIQKQSEKRAMIFSNVHNNISK